eukprot:7381430-Prymnesium_polylepis.1
MAGALGEQHAIAAASAVATSLESWGCCTDPNKWQFQHLEQQLVEATSECTRYLGDCWMLCTCSNGRADCGRIVANQGHIEWMRWRSGGPRVASGSSTRWATPV